MATLITLYEYGYTYASFLLFFYLNAASLHSSYAIWVWQHLGYAHLYFIIDYYYMGMASLDSSSAYEYGDTFAHLDANIIWVWQIYAHH